MEKEYIPYEQALALKELGFDEPCFGFYYMKEINLFESCKINERRNSSYVKDYMDKEDCSAPTFSQAFRWFRQKYDLFIAIVHYENGYSINDLRRFETYEEAELACLKKLIEIVKEKK